MIRPYHSRLLCYLLLILDRLVAVCTVMCKQVFQIQLSATMCFVSFSHFFFALSLFFRVNECNALVFKFCDYPANQCDD